jgi:hypothetical protein
MATSINRQETFRAIRASRALHPDEHRAHAEFLWHVAPPTFSHISIHAHIIRAGSEYHSYLTYSRIIQSG